jgi:hypothetical protein
MQDAAASEKSDRWPGFGSHDGATGEAVQTTQALIEKSPHPHKVKYHRCIKLNHLSVTMSTVRPDEWLTRDCIFSSRRRPDGLRDIPRKTREMVAVRVSVKLGERPPPLTSAGASPADDERQRGSRRDDFVRARA